MPADGSCGLISAVVTLLNVSATRQLVSGVNSATIDVVTGWLPWPLVGLMPSTVGAASGCAGTNAAGSVFATLQGASVAPPRSTESWMFALVMAWQAITYPCTLALTRKLADTV